MILSLQFIPLCVRILKSYFTPLVTISFRTSQGTHLWLVSKYTGSSLLNDTMVLSSGSLGGNEKKTEKNVLNNFKHKGTDKKNNQMA